MYVYIYIYICLMTCGQLKLKHFRLQWHVKDSDSGTHTHSNSGETKEIHSSYELLVIASVTDDASNGPNPAGVLHRLGILQ